MNVQIKELKNNHGHYLVQENGNEWHPPNQRNGMMPQFARYLLSAGVTPETPLTALRGSARCFKNDLTVGQWADITVREGDGKPRFVKYEKFEGVE